MSCFSSPVNFKLAALEKGSRCPRTFPSLRSSFLKAPSNVMENILARVVHPSLNAIVYNCKEFRLELNLAR
jgi:hypothetical protein